MFESNAREGILGSPVPPQGTLIGKDVMPTWAWILLIVVLVLALTGGIGFGRR